ncbi:hypothetical protein PAECIP111893_02399 [Paenibacillus plantiphilus]|uniref:Uncharacterized protein n=1 Tax=Paenibacillus plantiphilus TaxID=2905650 RepID=A0ABN8GCS4_9BACL|nr:hypothetical protein PAECIP111893_02399 [Paenibacillus plantiphilus]
MITMIPCKDYIIVVDDQKGRAWTYRDIEAVKTTKKS